MLWPRFLSPLRIVPGPPLGGIIAGQFPAIIQGEAGIPQREWVKQHGSAVRVVGPLGIERLIFTKADTLHKILVSEWMEHPRVRLSYIFLSFLVRWLTVDLCARLAGVPERDFGLRRWLWAFDGDGD